MFFMNRLLLFFHGFFETRYMSYSFDIAVL